MIWPETWNEPATFVDFIPRINKDRIRIGGRRIASAPENGIAEKTGQFFGFRRRVTVFDFVASFWRSFPGDGIHDSGASVPTCGDERNYLGSSLRPLVPLGFGFLDKRGVGSALVVEIEGISTHGVEV